MLRRIVALNVMLIMMAIVMIAITAEIIAIRLTYYEYSEDGFTLIVTVNHTEANVGDIIEITATFTNVSGKDIYIWPQPGAGNKDIEELLFVDLWHEGGLGVPYLDALISERFLKKKIIKKGAVFSTTVERSADEAGIYNAFAGIPLLDKGKRAPIISQPVKVTIKGENG